MMIPRCVEIRTFVNSKSIVQIAKKLCYGSVISNINRTQIFFFLNQLFQSIQDSILKAAFSSFQVISKQMKINHQQLKFSFII